MISGAPSRPKVAAAVSSRKSASAGATRSAASSTASSSISSPRAWPEEDAFQKRSVHRSRREARYPPGATRSRAGRSHHRGPDRGAEGASGSAKRTPRGISTVQSPSQPPGPRAAELVEREKRGNEEEEAEGRATERRAEPRGPDFRREPARQREQHDQEGGHSPVVHVAAAASRPGENGSDTARSPQTRPTRTTALPRTDAVMSGWRISHNRPMDEAAAPSARDEGLRRAGLASTRWSPSLCSLAGAVVFLWYAPASYQIYLALHILAVTIWVGGDITLTTLGIVFEQKQDGPTLAALGRMGSVDRHPRLHAGPLLRPRVRRGARREVAASRGISSGSSSASSAGRSRR